MTEKKEKKVSSRDKYTEATGRRKTSVARVRLVKASKTSILVNNRPFEDYFKVGELRKSILSVFNNLSSSFSVSAKIIGGGVASQAEALRHGIARALILEDSNLRTTLKLKGFLKRDPRAKERRKFGLKKARKAPQWSKR
jgi:small subunit ribosomal protein S9